MKTHQIRVPDIFTPLYTDNESRYIVYYGGRGGRKSWEFSRALLVRAMKKKLLILCAREIQNSINDSVMRLLADQIRLLGFKSYIHVGRTTIETYNGSEFIFKGLNNISVDNIKSLEGVDICWVEEAQAVSSKSWEILIPTIRKPGSQIFISFNPDLPSDPVYQMFVAGTPPPKSIVKKVTYLDNPDCPKVLIEEAEYMRSKNPEAYSHIWLGNVRANSDAQIFAGCYGIEYFEDENLGVPLYGCDWGFASDPTVLVKCYVYNNTLYIRKEVYLLNSHIKDLPNIFHKFLDFKNFVILADNSRPELIEYLKSEGIKIKDADKWAGCVEDRIEFIKNFDRIVIHPECKHVAEEFLLYSYKTDKRTGIILPEVDDKNNHCIDAIGYALTPIIKRKKKLTVGGNFRMQTF